jgi:F-type H+-transporting ATPase subunit delta
LISGSVAKRYAKALVEVAAGSDKLESVRQDLRALADLLKEHRDLRQFLANPSVSRRDAADVVADIGAAMRLTPLTAIFLRIVLDGGRLAGLAGILRAYELLMDERLGRVKAVVTSAAPLDTEAQDRLRRRLGEVTGKDVYLELRQDPTLLGGVVSQVGSRVYDGSLRMQLARLRDELVRA